MTLSQDEVRRKILNARRKQKEREPDEEQSEISPSIAQIDTTDLCILIGAPVFATLIMGSEPSPDFLVMGLVWVASILFFFFMFIPGSLLERVSYILLNICTLTMGERIRKIHEVPKLLKPVEWVYFTVLNLLLILLGYVLYVRRGSKKKQETAHRWDILLVFVLLANVAALLITGKMTFLDIYYRLTLLGKLLPI